MQVFVDVSALTDQLPTVDSLIKNYNPEFDTSENITNSFEFEEGVT